MSLHFGRGSGLLTVAQIDERITVLEHCCATIEAEYPNPLEGQPRVIERQLRRQIEGLRRRRETP